MTIVNPIKIYNNIIKETMKEIGNDFTFEKGIKNIPFEKADYIYEIHYEGIEIINNPFIESNEFLGFDFGLTFEKIKHIEQLEEYMFSLENIPSNFMNGSKFTITIDKHIGTLKIQCSSAKEYNFKDVRNIVRRDKIKYIKFLYKESVYELSFYNEFVLIKLENLTNYKKEGNFYCYINGIFKNNKFEPSYLIKKVENNEYIELINSGISKILSYHIIEKEECESKEIIELINKGDKVKEAVCLRVYDDEIEVDEENFDYKEYVYFQNFDDCMITNDYSNNNSNSDPDIMFWESVDNMLEK